MKVLLDENLDATLQYALSSHEVIHMRDMGWAGTQNGKLLDLAETSGFAVLITKDRGIPHQTNLSQRQLMVIVLRLVDPRPTFQLACVPLILEALNHVVPGTSQVIIGPVPPIT